MYTTRVAVALVLWLLMTGCKFANVPIIDRRDPDRISEFYKSENDYIEARRRAAGADRENWNHGESVGLAFSGGGIRSASLNLGVLQGLHRSNALERFDYVSGVSGGGYIASWYVSRLLPNGSEDVYDRQHVLIASSDPDRLLGSSSQNGTVGWADADPVTTNRSRNPMSKPRVLEGDFRADGIKTAIIVARFNSFITEKLLEGALDTLKRHGADPAASTVVYVPGAFEIPGVARKLSRSGKFDAVITLGCVIRGGTDHYVYVAGEAAKGVAAAGVDSPVPVIFGVLTVENLEQAIERAGTKMGNKGAEAALAAIEMVQLNRALDRELK